jgi:hypothetical protein
MHFVRTRRAAPTGARLLALIALVALPGAMLAVAGCSGSGGVRVTESGVSGGGVSARNGRVSGAGVTADGDGNVRGRGVSASTGSTTSEREKPAESEPARDEATTTPESRGTQDNDATTDAPATTTPEPDTPTAEPARRALYVSSEAGSDRNAGTREKPFRTLTKALEAAGDGGATIHLAAGSYPGAGMTGTHTVAAADLQILGGYASDFGERDPWDSMTVLEFVPDEAAGARAKLDEILTVGTRTNAVTGFVLDGIVIDGGSRNSYYDDEDNPSLSPNGTPSERLMSLDVARDGAAVIRNCMFINGGAAALMRINAGEGATVTIENNLFANALTQFVDLICSSGSRAKSRSTYNIRHNTFTFLYQMRRAATALNIGANVTANIDHNIFAFGDGVVVTNLHFETQYRNDPRRGWLPTGDSTPNEQVSFTNNVVHGFQGGVYRYTAGSNSTIVVPALNRLDASNLKAIDGNVDVDPRFWLNALYEELYRARYAEPEDDAATAEEDEDEAEEEDDGDLDFGGFGFGSDTTAEDDDDDKPAKAPGIMTAARYPRDEVADLLRPRADEAEGMGATARLND